MTSAPTETFEFCTYLVPGRELEYELFHRAIPALDTDPVNHAWQQQVAPFPLAPTAGDTAPDAPAPTERGTLIWDISWPTR